MNNEMIASLKMIYKPAIMYYGEWDFLPGLKRIALEKRKKNLYAEFIDRYYYKPLIVIFKDEDIVNIEKEEATVAYKSYYPNDKEV